MTTQLWQQSATELAATIAHGEASALEVVDAHLERIAQVNGQVGAITTVLAESARQAAVETDRRRAAGKPLGPLAGVPFTVKENIDVAGSATTHGIPAFQHAVAPLDAPLVARLRRADAIPLGRTNLPDLSLRFHTYSQLYGHTRNPWNPECSPGGSSGGEGVALATGLSPLGLGNDAGGSLRVPALFGGVTALKPSYGRFPADSSVGPRDLTLSSQLFPVHGPLARRVEDLRVAFGVLAGPDPRDPRVVPAPLRGTPVPRPLRVAVCADPGGLGVHPDTRDAVWRVARVLEDAGYLLEEVEVPRLPEALDTYGHLIMTEFGLSWPMLKRLLNAEGQRYIEYAMALRGPVDLAEYVRLTAVRLGLQRDWAAFLTQYPLLLGPVYTDGVPPVRFDTLSLEAHRTVANALRLCVATTLVGVPAVAVPTNISAEMPQGVQVVANVYREDLCLDAASVIEASLGSFTPLDPRRSR